MRRTKKTHNLMPQTNNSKTHWSCPNGNDILHIVRVLNLTPHHDPFCFRRPHTPFPRTHSTLTPFRVGCGVGFRWRQKAWGFARSALRYVEIQAVATACCPPAKCFFGFYGSAPSRKMLEDGVNFAVMVSFSSLFFLLAQKAPSVISQG